MSRVTGTVVSNPCITMPERIAHQDHIGNSGRSIRAVWAW